MSDRDRVGRTEPIIDPAAPICDAHHHLWDRPDQRYLLPELLADLDSGHNVTETVYVEWRSHWRTTGAQALRPVGETEFAAGVAGMPLRGGQRPCAAIVGYADLTLGAEVARVLEAHQAAAPDLFKGIRHVGSWDADPLVRGGPPISPPGLYRDRSFREGFAQLAPARLRFDAWVYQTQLDDLIDLARAFPHQPIVLNHTGGVLGVGAYADRRQQLFSDWRASIQELARCPNVYMKLGGLGMHRSGFSFHGEPQSSASAQLEQVWLPWFETSIEEFGARRCMFESNFPVDGASCTYAVLWNAFKRVARRGSPGERQLLLRDTACRFYGIA
ncbi:MAG TPA: amidohydrolase family protein [Ramlibacter sp.]|nr:amidohydrolase family protein [Ramlibacter sp.]